MHISSGDDDPTIRVIFTLGGCAAIEGATVIACASEKEMLERWRSFVLGVDPDMLIGHNIWRFDIPYLFKRAERVGVRDFAYLGRLKGAFKLYSYFYLDGNNST